MSLLRPIGLAALLLASAPVAWAQQRGLGPKDGADLPATDLERVKVGDVAPDFTLQAFQGPAVTLSDFRGDRNVVLVFYRGHW